MAHAILTMGLPGSGKSTTLQNRYGDQLDDYVLIDPDAHKERHPDYDPKNPSALHDWSKKMAEADLANAVAADANVIIDGTGTNAEKMVQRITRLQVAGYTTTVLYVTVSLKTALARNAARTRTVPESLVREKAELISTSFEIVAGYADEVLAIAND